MTEIALINIAPLFRDPNDSTLDYQIAEAFATTSGLLVTGFPGYKTLDGTAHQLQSFFALPETVKRTLALRKAQPGNRNLYRGFTPLPTEPHWAYNEIFDMGPEPPLPAPGLPSTAAFEESNVWPDEATAPGWQHAMTAYGALCRRIISLMVPAALRGLGKPATAGAHLTAGRNGVLRLLHYPVVPEGFELLNHDPETDAQGRRMITREHVDTGVLSILWQDEKGGLQFQGRDGLWREVPKAPGALSVHCGDLLEPIGGPQLAGTPHRVLGGYSDRCSIGYFGEPEFETLIDTPHDQGRKSYGRYLTDQFPTRFLQPA
ncbi:MAG: hypothetical protein GJ676_21250 [Rhodobacteraceae bacterium]|nr:hypothetical protein [Paracoccaceae bacterium]